MDIITSLFDSVKFENVIEHRAYFKGYVTYSLNVPIYHILEILLQYEFSNHPRTVVLLRKCKEGCMQFLNVLRI